MASTTKPTSPMAARPKHTNQLVATPLTAKSKSANPSAEPSKRANPPATERPANLLTDTMKLANPLLALIIQLGSQTAVDLTFGNS